jgi:hypothetical protein
MRSMSTADGAAQPASTRSAGALRLPGSRLGITVAAVVISLFYSFAGRVSEREED